MGAWKAAEGGVGRVREELGLQGEGWKGGLNQEQLKQLVGVAVKCVTDLPRERTPNLGVNPKFCP